MIPRITETGDGFRSKARWYASGILVLLIALGLFAYLTYVQVLVALDRFPSASEDFWKSLLEGELKNLLLVAMSAAFAYFFTLQDYQTTFTSLIRKVSASMQDTEGDGVEGTTPNAATRLPRNDLDFLESSVENMIQENTAFRSRLDMQDAFMSDNLVVRVLKGWAHDSDRAFQAAELYGIDLAAPYKQTIVIGIDEDGSISEADDDRTRECYRIVGTLLEQMARGTYGINLAETDGMLAGLVTSSIGPGSSTDYHGTEVSRMVWLARQIASDETGLALRASIGQACDDLASIAQSFSNAVDSLQYAIMIGDPLLVSLPQQGANSSNINADEYQWFREEMRFITCVRTAEYARAQNIYAHMLESDYLLKAPSLKLARFRLRELSSLLANALGDIRSATSSSFFSQIDVQDDLLGCETVQDLRNVADDVFDKLNYHTIALKSQGAFDKVFNIVEYLGEHYSDPNLSVGMIANAFGMNQSYLSRMFKQRMDIGLSEYIQHVRVRKAKELLLSTDITVKDAAEAVGFASVLTMNRAFKKIEGTTAGKVREIPQSADDEGEQEP